MAATNPLILWAVPAVLAARDLFFWVLPNPRPDTQSFMAAGTLYLRSAPHQFGATVEWLARTGTIPIPGAQGLALQPPTVIALTAPFSLLPRPEAVALWAAADALVLLGALLILDRMLRPRGPARPLFWIGATSFRSSPRSTRASAGGFVLLPAVAGVAPARARPAFVGALARLSAALPLPPITLAVGVRAAQDARPAFLVCLALRLLLSVPNLEEAKHQQNEHDDAGIDDQRARRCQRTSD